MVLVHLTIAGLRGADPLEIGPLSRVALLPDGPAGVAAADALSLLAAALEPARVPATLRDLEIAGPSEDIEVISQNELPAQATWARSEGADALLSREGGRRVVISADVKLDPVLYGRLREVASRDPQLAEGLTSTASLSLRVGWLFSVDRTAAAVALHEVSVGQAAVPLTAESPRWLPGFLGLVAQRLGRMRWRDPPEVVADRVLQAALSADPERRARARRACRILADPPFSLGALELVRSGDRTIPCFGPDLLRIRQLGPAAARALGLVEAAVLEAPDILVAEGQLEAPVMAWLADQVEGSDGILEQVLVAPGGAP